jgi:hypothetical protein
MDARNADAVADEAERVSGRAGSADDLLEVVMKRRLTAGEREVVDPAGFGLPKDSREEIQT